MLVGEARRRRLATLVACAATALATTMTAGLLESGSVEAAGFDCSAAPSYTVRAGDGWYSIAARIDVSVGALLEVNDADLDDLLLPGDDLCLPSGADLAAACERTRTIRAGDSWYGIASSAAVASSALLAVNGADRSSPLHPGQVVCLPPDAASSDATPSDTSARSNGSTGSYTVRPGDTWYGIAQRASVSVGSLLDANGADATEVIHPGRSVVLPAGATTPSAASTGPTGRLSIDALPLQGPCWYVDSWGAARSGGRRHLGTDLFALPRAYVYAVIDGTLTSRRWAGSGSISGNAWTLTGDDGTRVFYAHLSDFNPVLATGSRVEAGEILGWVGGTGNASSDHLHIEFRPGGGSPINPYPILSAAGGCNRGTPYTQPSGWTPD